ncbi:catechol 1,2-dioxygenase [Nocardia vinacea]|uniref:catechol 1,2-dioxygenase n=1 Tax=Nocardia vinacea TaxID=96468 RepID=UPI00342CA3DB
MTTSIRPTAAESGAGATARFKTDKSVGAAGTSSDRVDQLAREVIEAVHATIRKHKVTYAEYNAVKAWLIKMGESSEWPLFLDVWIEHVVEQVATENRKGNKGTIEGPYYVPDSPECGSHGVVPMRENEPGTPLTWTGRITSTDGSVIEGAKLELWHADDDGLYSQFASGIPEWNLRGTFTADTEGRFEIRTVRPAPYQIPTDGACGQLISAAGWHAWRPAHLHVKVSAPGHELLTAQLYFPDDVHNDDDIASAVKPELILDPQTSQDGSSQTVSYDFVLDPASA